MGEFSPVQLDALEDALEDLELSGIPLEFEDDVAVSGRLSEYRDLLQLSRDALPSVEVPAGVLDSVLAAARDEAALPSVGASPRADGSAQAQTPWWKRLSLWIPGLAVAASAALVLVMVQGTLSESEPADATLARADAAEEKPASKSGAVLERGDELRAAAELPAEEAEEEERFGLGAPESRGRLRGSAAVDRAGEDDKALLEEADADDAEAPAAALPSAPAAEVVPADPEPTDKVIYDKAKGAAPASKERNAKPSKASAPRTSGKKQDAPEPEPQQGPKPKPTPKKPESKAPAPAPGGGSGAAGDGSAPEPSESLASADANRRKGRCSAARSVYRGLVDHSDAKFRARALAGLGLCALADGDETGADAYFSRARKADSGIGSFISRERDAAEETTQQAL